jgi:hypothetical protein
MRQPAFGGGVRPELGRTDYSGIAQAGQHIGAGLASLGQAGGDIMRERRQMDSIIRSAQSNVKSLSNLPDLDPQLQQTLQSLNTELNDPNKSKREIAAIAKQSTDTLNQVLQIGAMEMQRQQSQAMTERNRIASMAMQEDLDWTRSARQQGGAAIEDILASNRDPEAIRQAQMRVAGMGHGDLAMQIGQQFGPPQPEANDVRARKINDLMTEMNGLTRLQAIDLVDGHARVINNPETGDVSLVNVRTGELRPVKLSDEFRAASDARATGGGEQQGDPISLYGTARETTGIFPAARAAAQRVTGQVNINTAPPELLENMQMFSAAQNDLIRALSINPRFPVAEMQRIQKEIDITPGAFMDPQTLQSKMRSVDRYLRNRVDREERASRDPSIPATERRAAITSANNIRNFLDVLGVPGEATDTEGQGQENYEIPPINVLPDEKLQRLNRYLQ